MSFNLHLSLSDFLLSFETYTVRDVISVKLRMHVPTFTSFSLSFFFFFCEIGIQELILRFTSLAGHVSVLFVVLLEVFGAFI